MSKAITKPKGGNGRQIMAATMPEQIRTAFGELVAACAAEEVAAGELESARIRKIDAAGAVNALVGETHKAATRLAHTVA